MSLRFKISPGRLLIVRPGQDADNPLLVDAGKIFDSNWNFSGYLLESGTGSWDTSNKAVSNLGCITTESSQIIIPFKRTYTFAPAAMVVGYWGASVDFPNITGYAAQGASAFAGAGSRVYNDRIVINRVQRTPNNNYWATEYQKYALFGVR
jgi:hypothetical protein